MSKLVLICFDISDKKRLRKTANVLLDYGKRVQHSIFECHIKNKDLNNLTKKNRKDY